MALDLKATDGFNKKLDKIETLLEDSKELFNSECLFDFKNERHDFIDKINISQQDGRTLQIGIIGAVKAGKSSFLNALLFDGEDVLPKAATPMTAALTKISYSDTPQAIIHFYEKKDWHDIEKLSDKYDSELDKAFKAYKAYCNQQHCNQNKQTEGHNSNQCRNFGDIAKKAKGAKGVIQSIVKIMSRDEYEKKKFRSEINENFISAKELTSMVKDYDMLDKLDSEVTISLDDIDMYIGANGKYTPIVNYVELQKNDERLKDIVVVDTPGLNDPIVSRGIVTKKFLSKCDVALLLSPTSQFMDVNTMQLMSKSLPNAGINELIVIGSKLDSGILDYPKDKTPLKEAAQQSVYKYRTQMHRNIETLKSTDCKIAKQLSDVKSIYVSSLIHSIICKRKRKTDLSEEENKILEQFEKRFCDFTEGDLTQLSGINNVQRELLEVIKRKEAIINEKNDSLLNNVQHTFIRLLNQISEDARSSLSKLKNSDIDQLKIRYSDLNELLESSRIQLTSAFEISAAEAEKTSKNTEIHLEKELTKYADIQTSIQQHDEERSRREGFLWLKKVHYTVTITEYYAEVSEVMRNIHGYIAKCKEIIDNDFNYILNKEQLSKRVKNIVIKAMHSSGGTYSEDDVLMPLNAVLAKITVPYISINADEYIDEISTEFNSGRAKGNEIHKLSQRQGEILSRIFNDLNNKLQKCVNDIKDMLIRQSDTFADNIINKLKEEFERLEAQMHHQEEFIERYDLFINNLSLLRQDLSE